MSIAQDELNFLIYRYMQENGFQHSAFLFESEALIDTSNANQSHVPPNSLITLLQKALQYMKLEKSIKEGQSDPNNPSHSGIKSIEETYSSDKSRDN